jgi:hypothetical protein
MAGKQERPPFKRCTRCEVLKPLEKFLVGNKDAMRSICRECDCEIKRRRREESAKKKGKEYSPSAVCSDCGKRKNFGVVDGLCVQCRPKEVKFPEWLEARWRYKAAGMLEWYLCAMNESANLRRRVSSRERLASDDWYRKACSVISGHKYRKRYSPTDGITQVKEPACVTWNQIAELQKNALWQRQHYQKKTGWEKKAMTTARNWRRKVKQATLT